MYPRRTHSNYSRLLYPGLITALALTLAACEGGAPVNVQSGPALAVAGDADKLLVVDCLLPGQIRKLGTQATYLTPRRPIRTTASDCEIRGGEYVAYDRANYASALKVWLPQAQAGDAKAQVYVGEIYERGLGIQPDYELAAQWYRKAADQGDSRAQINLGALYEQGLGVSKDKVQALNWYRRASGLNNDQLAFSSSIQELEAQRASATEEVGLRRREAERLRTQLDQTRNELQQQRRRLQDAQQELQNTRLRLQQERSSRPAPVPSAAPRSTPDPALEKRLAEQREQLEAERQRVAFLQQQAKRNQAQLTSELKAAQQREDELRQTLAARSQEQQNLQSQLSNLQQQLSSSQQQLSSSEQRLQQQQAELAQTQAELTQLKSAPATSQDSDAIRQLEQQLAANNTELNRTRQQIDALQTEVDVRQSQLSSAREREQALAADVEAQQRQTESLQQQVDYLKQQQFSARDQLNESRERQQQQQTELEQTQAQLDELKASTAQRDNEAIQQLEQQLAAKNAELASTQARINELEQEMTQSESQLELALRGGSGSAPTATAAASSSSAPDLNFGRYYALVIGNDNYANYPNLKTAVRDAQAVASVLRSRYGFNTKVLTNVDRYGLLSALNEFRSTLTENDNFLLYYAGHGELLSQDDGYWLPIDAEPGNTANWVSNPDITRILDIMPAKHVMVIADSCYSGTLQGRAVTTSAEGNRAPAKRDTWYQLMIQTRSRTALTSGGTQPVLDTGGGQHSLFARQLLNVLQGNSGVLEGPLLFREVNRLVRSEAAKLNVDQTPAYAPIKFAGDLGAPFFFRPTS